MVLWQSRVACIKIQPTHIEGQACPPPQFSQLATRRPIRSQQPRREQHHARRNSNTCDAAPPLPPFQPTHSKHHETRTRPRYLIHVLIAFYFILPSFLIPHVIHFFLFLAVALNRVFSHCCAATRPALDLQLNWTSPALHSWLTFVCCIVTARH